MASPSGESLNEFVAVLQENREEMLADQHQKAVHAEMLLKDAVPAVVPHEGVVLAVAPLVESAPAVAPLVESAPAVAPLVEPAPAAAQYGTELWGGCLLDSPTRQCTTAQCVGSWYPLLWVREGSSRVWAGSGKPAPRHSGERSGIWCDIQP